MSLFLTLVVIHASIKKAIVMALPEVIKTGKLKAMPNVREGSYFK